MGILIVSIGPTSQDGHRLARGVLWPSCGPPNSKPLILFPLDGESEPFAFSAGEHFGNIVRRRENILVEPCSELLRGNTLPREVAEMIRDYCPVIVARQIDRFDIDQVIRLKTMLEKASGGTVTVGALENDTGKHNELVVRTPEGA